MWSVLILLLAGSHPILSSAVIELNEDLLNLKEQVPLLVKFYAPWCGYCRRLEPVYEEVARKLQGSSVKVGRLDATVYPATASLYEVRGYPTIKFIYQDKVLTHQGERSAERILQFVDKASSPSIRNISNWDMFHKAMEKAGFFTFFLYIGPYEGSLYDDYKRVAEDYQLKTFFYACTSVDFLQNNDMGMITSFLKTYNSALPTIIAVKDGAIYFFSKPDEGVTQSHALHRWVLEERFPPFPKLNEMDLYDYIDSKEFVAIFVLNQTNIQITEKNADKSMFRIGMELARARTPELERPLQLGYMFDIAAASTIVMGHIPVPNLVIIKPSTQHFYLRPTYAQAMPVDITKAEILDFLQQVVAGNVSAYGGDGFFAKLQRGGYDFVTGLLSFIATSPGLALFVLGTPIGVVSFLVYAICCLDLGGSEMEEYEERREHKVHSQKTLITEYQLPQGGKSEFRPLEEVPHSNLRARKPPSNDDSAEAETSSHSAEDLEDDKKKN